jgi:hypothetical protein
MNPVKSVFPKYSAAVVQVKTHGADATQFAKEAYQAPDLGARLDGTLRAFNSFDHALTASKELPVDFLVPGLGGYRAGYEAARAAAALLISTGAIPGARERVGRQELTAAREELFRGVGNAAGDTSRFGRYRSLDFLDASISDAAEGLLMLRKPTLAGPLLDGLRDVRNDVSRKVSITPERLGQLNSLFDRAGAEYDELILQAEKSAVGVPVDRELTAAAVAHAQDLLAAAAGMAPAPLPESVPAAG